MGTFTKLKKATLAISTIGGTWYLFKFFNEGRNQVYNSWTTNYLPSTTWDDNWDHRSPKSIMNPKLLKGNNNDDNVINQNIESHTPKASRHLILVRHGQYNMKGLTDAERYLTPLGRNQAEYTGKRLKELGYPYTSVIKSTMARAQETGDIIIASLNNIPIKNCNLIREGAPIPPEPPVGHWRPETQQFYQDGARIEAAFREYFYRADVSQEKDTYTILICHANVIRYFICRALQFPPEAWLRFSLNHASITWVTISPKGRVILKTLGDSGHLPVDAITS
ncbi:hypothetical protein FQA39_LY16267 [Lamprigera yunnana]|nr:hypothetical protein FQA39_LY16267 [Lamprigera yunnana]